jgi:hypothetical protein
MRANQEQDAKINVITSNIEEILNQNQISDRVDFLSSMSEIICQFDTDIAIGVMERLGPEGREQAMTIKVNYGY